MRGKDPGAHPHRLHTWIGMEEVPPARSRRWPEQGGGGARGGVAVSLLCLLARGGRRQREAPGGLGRTGGLPAQELGQLLAPGGALGGLQVGGAGRLLLFFYISVMFSFI